MPTQNDAKTLKMTGPLAMGTHLRVLSENYLMNTNMTGFSNSLCILVLWMKVALALEGLIVSHIDNKVMLWLLTVPCIAPISVTN